MESENLVKAKEAIVREQEQTEVAVNKARTKFPVKEEKHRKYNAIFNKDWANRVPEHMRNLVYILHNNTEIRRYTAIGIINYLLQKGEISGEKRYVNFLWNKFTVKVDGMSRDYYYTETFFLNCLVASFASFSASAQHTINAFCKAEMSCNIENAVKEDEIQTIVESNNSYESYKEED